jgi:predicted GIY-YIG superfamily endonuclease
MASVAIVPIVAFMLLCASLPLACYADRSFTFCLKTLMSRRHHHHVYVVELSPDVMYEPRFKKANPDYIPGKLCVYVGMTGLDPDQRFDKHKAGIQSNKYVEKFGLRLLPELYAVYNPMPYEAACEMEVELGIALREAGYGVWQA